MFSGGIRSEIARQRFDISGYLALYQPALDWIMQALAAQDSELMLDDIIKQCQDKKNKYVLQDSRKPFSINYLFLYQWFIVDIYHVLV